MPVTGLGPLCHRCNQKPVLPADLDTGLCVRCSLLDRVVGRQPASVELTGFDAHPADSPEFEGELRAWIDDVGP